MVCKKERIDRTPATNRRLAQWRVTWLIEHSTSHQLLWCIDSFVLRNRQLLIAAKRYKLLGILRDKILFLKAIEISISTIPKIIPAKKSLKLNPVVGVIFSLREWFSSFKASREYSRFWFSRVSL